MARSPNDPMLDTGTPAVAGKRVALGVAGGIAAYKAVEIMRGLQRAGCAVRVALTRHACEFIRPLTFRALTDEPVIVDDYAPENPDPIAHVSFSQSVDLFLVAPATANLIAKFAAGIADDFLTTAYLATTAPVIIAPAMNPRMWDHPATQRAVAQLRADGVHVIEPDCGEMACGAVGPGRLSEPEKVVQAALRVLVAHARDLAGERILITAGATREEIDPVRFISNRSSGRMGFALAEAALARGAQATVVAAATSAPEPFGARIVRVSSADEMLRAVMCELPNATIFIAAAAVADYRPVARATRKIKKSEQRLTLELEPTPDILSEVARQKRDSLIVIGFAAETERVAEHAREKLKRKGLDLIVANDVSQQGAGFDTETNIVTLIARDRERDLPRMTKLEVAHCVLDEAKRLRAASVWATSGDASKTVC
ncbi:bifunctional phosphopantothenoylcysteine decarboxylase/phosphopantothenate--cysteine ligase CoaBC [Pyrinomonas sp.]|uniref:bifunctional phosphopantothenoylcysteine decarboxylase/phosphopantothenate--cysteine ligase CoaBC n=1 Tax=Pyrinomonas sp. TaxID=2080306 RepID=UPI00332AEA09